MSHSKDPVDKDSMKKRKKMSDASGKMRTIRICFLPWMTECMGNSLGA